VFSTDGNFSYDLEKGSLKDGSKVMIAEAPSEDAAGTGETIVAGPFSVSTWGQAVLNTATHLRFRLSRDPKQSASQDNLLPTVGGFDPKTLEIRWLDPRTQKWTPMATVINTDLSIISTSTDQLGRFVLVSKAAR